MDCFSCQDVEVAAQACGIGQVTPTSTASPTPQPPPPTPPPPPPTPRVSVSSVPHCGDSVVQSQRAEECDKGGANGNSSATFLDNGKWTYCTASCQKKSSDCVWATTYAKEITAHEAIISDVMGRANDRKSVPSCLKQDWPEKGCEYKDYGAVSTLKCHSTPRATLQKFLGIPITKTCTKISRGICVASSEDSRGELYYMDSKCDIVANPGQLHNLCGYAGIVSTPISLIFGDSVALRRDARVVQFDLNPMYTGHYTIWLASTQTPLLVVDAERTKKITAQNLFGHWTFGGRTDDPFSHRERDYAEIREPWRNGFEALGGLDKNGDERVSGAELAPLALWFDNNRDAILDEGELKTLHDVGITEVFYAGAELDPTTSDLELTVGYVREVNGTKQAGASIDWFADTFDSERSAADALSSQSVARQESLGAKAEEYLQFAPARVGPVQSDLSGFWTWTLDSETNAVRPGMFAMQQDADGALHGYSVAEALLERNEFDLNSVIKTIAINGKVVSADGQNRKAIFSSRAADGSSELESDAELSADGMTLRGVSHQKLLGPNLSTDATVTMTYRWTARRVIGPDSKPINGDIKR